MVIEIPRECRLVFCVGVGGVGKTTFAAALGLREALRGRSVLVLTADPARRLADALGVHGLVDVPSDISLPHPVLGGELHAAMLETKASADQIILRAAQDAERAKRVLENRIYRAFSNTLARSHAYAAMERMHETIHDSRYDLVVVDTPPAQSSIEILDAPVRLVGFLDQRVVRWFLQASEDSQSLRGMTLAQRLLKIVAGESLVAALTEFLSEMAFLREGFAKRAKDVWDFTRSAETSFVLVSSPDWAGVEAAKSVAGEVAGRGFRLEHLVFNRAFIPEIDISAGTSVDYPPILAALAPKLRQMRSALAAEQAHKTSMMLSLHEELAVPTWALPEASRPLGSTSALAAWIDQARAIHNGR
jgi:anion-transporting  ArsA/GET3 family ATPase